MDIIVDADCGNAPKKALVRDWLIAAAEGHHEAVAAQLSDEARWEVVGTDTHQGRDAVTAALTGAVQASRLRISLLLSHGKHIAAEGELQRGDGTTHRFAHLLTFDGHGKSAKVGEIVTFLVQTA